MNRFPTIVILYLIKNFFNNFCYLFSFFSFIAIIVDLFELIRKVQNKEMILSKLLLISFFKFPFIVFEFLPFIFLFSSVITFTKFNNSNELLAIKSSGLSYVSLMSPFIVFILGFSFCLIFFFQPISAAMLDKNRILENNYFGYKSNRVSIKSNGIWIIDKEDFNSNSANDKIIFAEKITADDKILSQIMIMVAGEKNNYTESYYAQKAKIIDNNLKIFNVTKFISGEKSINYDELTLKTSIKPSQLQEVIKNPELISFWSLSKIIDKIKKSGMNATKHEVYYKNLFNLPFLFASIIIYGFVFSLNSPRQLKIGIPYIKASILGLVIYVLNKMAAVLSLTAILSIEVSLIIPLLIYLSIAGAYLIHKDESSF